MSAEAFSGIWGDVRRPATTINAELAEHAEDQFFSAISAISAFNVVAIALAG